MARIAGVDLPRDKRLEISLTYIFGVGRSRALEICDHLRIDPGTKVRDLTEEEAASIRRFIDANYQVEGNLRRQISQNIRRKTEINCYQGIRHRRGLPVRGQRTRKGRRMAVAGKKKPAKH